MSQVSEITVRWTPETSGRVLSIQIASRIKGGAWGEVAAAHDPAAGVFTFASNAPGAEVEVRTRFRMVTGVFSPWTLNDITTASIKVPVGEIVGANGSLGQLDPSAGTKLGGIATGADVTGNNTSRDTAAVGGRPSTTVIQQLDTKATKAEIDATIAAAKVVTDKTIGDADTRLTKAAKDADDKAASALLQINDPASGVKYRLDKLESNVGGENTGFGARLRDVELVVGDASTGLVRRTSDLDIKLNGNGGISAKVSTLEQAYSDPATGLASRTITLEATARGGGNLLSNSAFSTLDGWAVDYNAAGGRMVRNDAGAPWQIGGVENNLTLRVDAAHGGLAIQAKSIPFAVRPGSYIQFYALTANHRCRSWVSVSFEDANGADVGYGGENFGAPPDNGGTNIAGHATVGNQCFLVPGNAVRARMLLRQYDVTSDGYAWFHRPFVSEVQAGAKGWLPYAPGSDKPVVDAARARLTTAEQVLGDAAGGIVKRTTDLETGANGPGGTNARLSTAERAISTNNIALAQRASTLEAAASAVSTSIIYNDNFNFWPDAQSHPSRWNVWEGNGNYRTERLSPGRGGGLYCVRTLNDSADVNSGFVQGIHTAGPGKWVLEVTADFDVSGARGAGVTLSGVHNLDFCAEPDVQGVVGDRAGVVRSWTKMFDLDARDTWSVHAMHGWMDFGRGVAAKYMVWHRLALRPATQGEILAGKADAALNNPGGLVARLGTVETATTDGRFAQASRVTTLEAYASGAGGYLNANHQFQQWPDGQALPSGWQFWGSDQRAVGRIASGLPQSPYAVQFDGYQSYETGFYQVVPGMSTAGWYVVDADVSLVGGPLWNGSGLTINGVRNFAFAFEADVNGVISGDKQGNRRWSWLVNKPDVDWLNLHAMNNYSPLGNLHGKVLNWHSLTIRPATDGEIRAQKVDNQVNGTGGLSATVTEAKTAAVNATTKLAAARLEYVAQTPGGRASLTIRSDNAGGGAGIDLVGNVNIDGNLTTSGTITAGKFNGSSMSREGESSYSNPGGLTPGFGESYVAPWGLTIAGIAPLGRLTFDINAVVATNAGTISYDTHPDGRQIIVTNIADGGFAIRASDLQGNIYARGVSGSQKVLATTPFDANFQAIIVRGNTNNMRDMGDVWRQDVSAVYSLMSFTVKVTWLAI